MSYYFPVTLLTELLPQLGFYQVSDAGNYWLRDLTPRDGQRSQVLVVEGDSWVSLRELRGIDQQEMAQAPVSSPADLLRLLGQWQ